jgi:hypothetical protein
MQKTSWEEKGSRSIHLIHNITYYQMSIHVRKMFVPSASKHGKHEPPI